MIDKYQAIKDLGLRNFNPIKEELDSLAMLSATISPIHLIPELKDHTPLPFIFKMMDEVASPEDVLLFEKGYQTFGQYTLENAGKRFKEMNDEEKLHLITALNSELENGDLGMQKFYKMVKRLNLHYLKSSEYYQKKVHYYEMEPGRFKGNVLLSELQNRNTL